MYIHKWVLSPEEYAMVSKDDFYKMHQSVWDLFGNKESERNFLYRVLIGKELTTILIQGSYPTKNLPTLGKIISKKIGTKINGRYKLSATLNPIVEKSRMNEGKKNSQRVPLVLEQDLKKWVNNLFSVKGFKLENFVISPVVRNYSRIKGYPITTCEINGVVKVEDEMKASIAFEKGVGKERAFGCGLLCLIPLWESAISSDENEDSDDNL